MHATKPRLMVPVSKRDHIQGDLTAAITLVEYGDFECPHCAAAHLSIKAIQNRMGDQLCFVFRHFPLSTLHPHATQAAEASEAAGAQDEFWPMHDVLFESQESLEYEDLLADAQSLGLDPARFTSELMEHRYEPRVKEDFHSGVRSGVNGTPSLFINGVRHDEGYDFDSLLSGLQAAMQK